ncbi:MAG: MMPL family transporter [Phycisphaerae bacterium]
MFEWLSASVARRAWAWLGGWLAVAVLLTWLSPSRARLEAVEPPSLIPADQPYNRSLELERRAFPELASRTHTVLVFERPAGLTAADHVYLGELTERLRKAGRSGTGWRLQSPADQPLFRSRLLSSDGQAALVVVLSDANYVTHHSQVEVQRIEAICRSGLPAGLVLEITGEGGLGRDLGGASARAYRRTTWVTVIVLLGLLALIHRSPLAALVPLATVGVSVYVALAVLNLLAVAGWGIGDIEKTFVVVLLFGSGVDYSLFWIWRYREVLADGGDRILAVADSLTATGPAIATSAATTILGFVMLTTARLLPSHNAGRTLAIALSIALAAALTLVPATVRLMGRAFFWPRRIDVADDDKHVGLWNRAASWVTARPGTLVLVVLVGLCPLIWAGWHVQYQYDALGVLPAGSSAARGQPVAERHFGADRLFSWTCLVRAPGMDTRGEFAARQSMELGDLCAGVEGVSDVWSLATPLGRSASSGFLGDLAGQIGRRTAAPFYVNANEHCLRLEVMVDAAPLSRRAMDSCRATLGKVRQWAESSLGPQAQVYATGLTPYILNIKALSDRDHLRVTGLVVAAIGLVVLIWVRRVVLTVCMVAATLLVYMATLGAANLLFVYATETAGIDWKVRLFLFVVLVAVGQDYNIFVVSRILEERRRHPPAEAVRAAVVRTGSVISSCGLIMAATLCSLAATGLPLLQQLGFAFAFGVLLDTFVVRPLVIPAAYLLSLRIERPKAPSVAGSRPDDQPGTKNEDANA